MKRQSRPQESGVKRQGPISSPAAGDRADPNRRRFLLAVSAMLVAAAVWLKWSGMRHGIWVDLDVYAMGGRAILAGDPLYGITVHHLPFTYSPFAATLFVPFAIVPAGVARILLTIGSLLCYFVIAGVLTHKSGLATPWAAILVALGVSLEPFMRNVLLGQINLVLICLVVLDCLVLPSSRRGWLVGVAAGVKIVPGVFVLYFLLRRDWGAALRVAISFAATVLLGFVVAPDSSWWFWSGGFASTDKFGAAAIAGSDNQSLLGIWIRLTHDASPSLAVTGGLCLLGLVLGLSVARLQLMRGRELDAVIAISVGSLLASPISWTHHWLWIIPAMMMLASRRQFVTASLLGVLFWVGPMWFLRPGHLRDLHLAWWQQVVAASYVLVGIVLLGIMGWTARTVAVERPLAELDKPREGRTSSHGSPASGAPRVVRSPSVRT